jgi:transposase
VDIMEEGGRVVRRRHSAEFKPRIVAACSAPGALIARLALAHGLNANVVHKWRRLAQRAGALRAPDSAAVDPTSFVPVSLTAAASTRGAEAIRIELRRGATAATVIWPTSAAAECAAWLRDWFK